MFARCASPTQKEICWSLSVTVQAWDREMLAYTQRAPGQVLPVLPPVPVIEDHILNRERVYIDIIIFPPGSNRLYRRAYNTQPYSLLSILLLI